MGTPGRLAELEAVRGAVAQATHEQHMNESRNYEIDLSGRTYEDDLPDDMTDADYEAWFLNSWVSIVRIGPAVRRLDNSAGDQT